MAVNGTTVVVVLAGSVLGYSAVKGKSISGVVRSLLEGSNPANSPTVNALVAPVTAGSTVDSGSNPTVGGGGTVGIENGQTSDNALSYSEIKQLWINAGGPGGPVAIIAAAITEPESGRRPDAVQKGQPYSKTGWGLWQITPGNSVPSAGVDDQLLIPANNAKAAVAKFKAAGNSFTPWTTYTSGKYLAFMGAAQNG